MLMAAVALLLLVACANLANLMLVRATARRKELAIRQALGARPWRLARELVVEAVLLSCAGAGLGVFLAYWAVPALVALSPTAMPRSQDIGLNVPVLLFTATVAVLAGLGFGLVPAWRTLGAAPTRDLQSSRGGTGGAERSRARGLIVAAEVAVMVVLLSGASLLFRSFHAMMRIEPGFDANALIVRLSLPRKDYPDNQKISRFYDELEARVRALPGVRLVAATNHVPAERRPGELGLQGRGPAARVRGPAPDGAVPHGDACTTSERWGYRSWPDASSARATAPLSRPSRSSASLSRVRASLTATRWAGSFS